MRLFFAVPLTDDAKERVRPLLEGLRGPGLAATRAEQLHFTLAFLGEVPAEHLDRLATAAEALSTFPPFQLSLQGMGAFPDLRRPRVIWLGVEEGRTELCAVAERLHAGLRSQGFALEDRAFAPHLTLARVKNRVPSVQGPPGEIARFKVDAVHLVQSILGGSRGATHTAIRTFPLRGEVR